MQYLGGKARLAKRLVPYIQAELARPEIRGYVEPFMGGGNVFCQVRVRPNQFKHGSDIHRELMALWQYVQAGGDLPTEVTEADYARAKRGEGPDWWRGFVGFGCSFGGKWMGGFARGGHGADGPTTASVLLRQREGLRNATLSCEHFQVGTTWTSRKVIYCDPPYAQTTGYRGGFDHGFFWEWCRAAAHDNILLVSEYNAPADVPCIAEFPKKMGLRSKDGTQQTRTERLYRLAPEWANKTLDTALAGV